LRSIGLKTNCASSAKAAIPSTATRKALYALRNRIERFFNRAKNSRRVATRYDKLMESFAACLHPNLD
jgi:transposase